MKNKNNYTIIITGEETGEPTRLSCPGFIIKNFTKIIVSFFVFVLILSGFGFWGLFNLTDNYLLKSENESLKSSLSTFEEKIAVVEDEVKRFREIESDLRVVADLLPTDNDVWMMGVGGGLSNEVLNSSEVKEDISNNNNRLDRLIRQTQYLKTSINEAAKEIENKKEEWKRIPSICPIEGVQRIGKFGYRRHPLYHRMMMHEGVDLTAQRGTLIRATADGVVSFAGWKSGYGYTVMIDHGKGISTYYCHCSILKVREGDTVKRGDVIARVGSSGLASGPHLHYEVRIGGVPVNPLDFILPNDISISN